MFSPDSLKVLILRLPFSPKQTHTVAGELGRARRHLSQRRKDSRGSSSELVADHRKGILYELKEAFSFPLHVREDKERFGMTLTRCNQRERRATIKDRTMPEKVAENTDGFSSQNNLHG